MEVRESDFHFKDSSPWVGMSFVVGCSELLAPGAIIYFVQAKDLILGVAVLDLR